MAFLSRSNHNLEAQTSGSGASCQWGCNREYIRANDSCISDCASDNNIVLHNLGLDEERRLKCTTHIVLRIDDDLGKCFKKLFEEIVGGKWDIKYCMDYKHNHARFDCTIQMSPPVPCRIFSLYWLCNMEKETRLKLWNIQGIPTQQIWEDGILSIFVLGTASRSIRLLDRIH